MRQKKIKLIKNKYVGTGQWRKDPTISDEEIDVWNNLFISLGKEHNTENIAKELIWNKKKKNVTLQVIK